MPICRISLISKIWKKNKFTKTTPILITVGFRFIHNSISVNSDIYNIVDQHNIKDNKSNNEGTDKYFLDEEYTEEELFNLKNFIGDSKNIVALTGAGLSTESGIPDYRGPNGSYKQGHKPIQHMEFIKSETTRARYWARSMVGWEFFSKAKPNDGHHAIAFLNDRIQTIITQNVDGLHSKASALNKKTLAPKQNIIDLHGRNDRALCMDCGTMHNRDIFQDELLILNKEWNEMYIKGKEFVMNADGDAKLTDANFADFKIPPCKNCGSCFIKPDVVFFGDTVPKSRVEEAMTAVENAEKLIVIGTSLFVFSGFRFVKTASKLGIPIGLLVQGETRACKDDNIKPSIKIQSKIGSILPALVKVL